MEGIVMNKLLRAKLHAFMNHNYIHKHTSNPQANLERRFNSIKWLLAELWLAVRRVRVI